MTNIQVVEQNVLSHGPELNANTALDGIVERRKEIKRNETPYNLLEALDGGVILEVTGVGDLSWGPLSLVLGVVDHRSVPLALEQRIDLQWLLPLTTPGDISTLGVGNGWSDPVTVLLLVPFLRLLGVGVRDGQGFVVEPALRLGGFLVDDFVGSVFIPVFGLCERLDRIGSATS